MELQIKEDINPHLDNRPDSIWAVSHKKLKPKLKASNLARKSPRQSARFR
jgi:hypothetical protein